MRGEGEERRGEGGEGGEEERGGRGEGGERKEKK